MRLPEELEELFQEFNEIKSRQRNSIIQRNKFAEVVNMNMNINNNTHPNMMTQMESTETQHNLITHREADRKVRAHFSQSKSTFDAYLSALKIMSNKIAKLSNVTVFRIAAEICSDSYGADGDIIQYIKIKEIIKKTSDKPTSASTSTLSPSKKYFSRAAVETETIMNFQHFNFKEPPEGKSSSAGRESVSNHSTPSPRKGQARKSIFSYNINRAFNRREIFDGGDTVPNENEDGLSEEVIRLDFPSPRSPRTSTRKILQSHPEISEVEFSRSSVSSKEEEEDQSQESANSGKIALVNELKYTIMNQFQNTYYKEENVTIDKEFKNLNKLKWFIYFFFTLMTPLAVVIHFNGLHKSLDLVVTSVSNIYSNERLRRDFLKAGDAMITIAMHNVGRFDSTTAVTPSQLDEMIQDKLEIIKDLYQDILVLNSENEWLRVLYKYVPIMQETKTINYGGDFSEMTVTTESLLQKLINDLSVISLFDQSQFVKGNPRFMLFQTLGVDTFDRVLYEVSLNFFEDIDKSFYSSRFLLIWFAITICVAFLISLVLIVRFILIVIQSLKQILISFTAIDLQTVRETEDYYQRLLYFFTTSTSQFIYDQPHKSFFKDTEAASIKKKAKEQKFQKKHRQIQENKFMKKETMTILSYFTIGLLLYALLNLLFFLITYTSIHTTTETLHDAKEIIKIDTIYTSTLIALKMIILDPTTASYKVNFKESMDSTLDSLGNILSAEIIKGNSQFSDFARGFLQGQVCTEYKMYFTETNQAEECQNLALGKLSTGLAPFHNYYSGLVLQILQLKAKLASVLSINDIYEFGELIDIINMAFMEQGFELWRGEMRKTVVSHQRTFIGLIVGLVVLDAVIFMIIGIKIISLLQRKFLFYRRVYNKYMLTEALNKEKLIKAALTKYQLLNK